MAHDRDVAGIRCLEVLELLSAYLDDEVSADDRARVEAHLRGCDWCERFGGRFSGVVAALRRELREPEPLGADVAQRLAAALGIDT